KRLHWTPLYSSQLFPVGEGSFEQKSSFKNDLIELKYVLHQLIWQRAYETKMDVFTGSGFDHRIKTESYGLLQDDFFADPDRMNKNPIRTTARGWNCMKRMLEFPPDIG